MSNPIHEYITNKFAFCAREEELMFIAFMAKNKLTFSDFESQYKIERRLDVIEDRELRIVSRIVSKDQGDVIWSTTATVVATPNKQPTFLSYR